MSRAVLRGGATKLGGPEPDTIVGKAKAGYEICMPFYTIDQQHLYEICFKPDDDSVGWSMPSLFPWCTDVSNMREGKKTIFAPLCKQCQIVIRH